MTPTDRSGYLFPDELPTPEEMDKARPPVLTGSEWKALNADEALWTEGAYWDEYLLRIDGVEFDDVDESLLADDARVEIHWGYMHVPTAPGSMTGDKIPIEEVVGAWLKKRKTVRILVDVAPGAWEAVRAAAKSSGGSVPRQSLFAKSRGSVIVTGEEWRRFTADGEHWPEGGEMIDERLLVDGRLKEEDPGLSVDPAALVEIEYGAIGIEGAEEALDFVEWFRGYLARRPVRCVRIDAPVSREARVRDALLSAGAAPADISSPAPSVPSMV